MQTKVSRLVATRFVFYQKETRVRFSLASEGLADAHPREMKIPYDVGQPTAVADVKYSRCGWWTFNVEPGTVFRCNNSPVSGIMI